MFAHIDHAVVVCDWRPGHPGSAKSNRATPFHSRHVRLGRDFGRIALVDYDLELQAPDPKSAVVYFDRALTAKNALIVSNVCSWMTRIVGR